MSKAKVTSKGQITIPKDIRDILNLDVGDKVEFILQDDRVVLRAATASVKDLKGILPKPKRKVSLDMMEEAIKTRGGRKC